MCARPAVLLSSLDATLLDCLLSYKQNVPVNLLESTLAGPLLSVAHKGLITPLESALTKCSPATPLDATLTKNAEESAAAQYQPPITRPLVPLRRPTPGVTIGATMGNVPPGTTGSGKHIAATRCLRLKRRHSGLQVVPGSSVLE